MISFDSPCHPCDLKQDIPSRMKTPPGLFPVLGLALGLACQILVAQATAAVSGPFDNHGDVGSPAHPGSMRYDAARRAYTVTGGGANMWGTNNALHFVWQHISGDVALSADIEIPQTRRRPASQGLPAPPPGPGTGCRLRRRRPARRRVDLVAVPRRTRRSDARDPGEHHRTAVPADQACMATKFGCPWRSPAGHSGRPAGPSS